MIRNIEVKWIVLYYIGACMLMGLFLHIIILLLIMIMHELGHIIAAYMCKRKVRKIIFSIFGGSVVMDELFSDRLSDDIIITLAGPFTHLLLYPFIWSCHYFAIGNPYILEMIHVYNFLIFFFNMLPIYPLDGGKLLQLLLQKYFPVYYVYKYTAYLSISCITSVVIILLMSNFFTLQIGCVILFMLIENIRQLRFLPYTHIRFLLWKQVNLGHDPVRVNYVKDSAIVHRLTYGLFRSGTNEYISLCNGQAYSFGESRLIGLALHHTNRDLSVKELLVLEK